MRKEKIKSYLAGILTATIITTLCVPSFASSVKKQITATYNNIKLYVDGAEVTPKDASGKTVEPFVVDGTTYLPVRAVASALGKEVTWDGATQSVYVGEKPANTPSSNATATGTVLFDKSGIKITYNGVSASSSYIGKFDVNLTVENSTSAPHTVQVRDFSANGYMVDPIFSCDVAAGKKANDEITITSSDTEKNGIAAIENLEFKFVAFNSDTWGGDIESPTIKIQCK